MNPLFPSQRDIAGFLDACWQKQSYFESSPVRRPDPELSVDEVAWLAMQPDVESRLVINEADGDQTRYVVEHGPFEEARLEGLPASNWTLLVQDVEKHLPAFRKLFDIVPFVPDWRIDDLMVSVAAPGGGVGPHRDHYDVFLLQGQGEREWRLGDPYSVENDPAADALSLLLPFTAVETYHVRSGDVLYLPPGLPHWGIARSLTTTWSIGMRAPNAAELAAGADRLWSGAHAATGEARFYEDADLAADESVPGMISRAAVRRLRHQALIEPLPDDTGLAMLLGAVATDPKAWLMPEPVETLEAVDGVHAMTRLAWYEHEDTRLVFVNGACRSVDVAALATFQHWCRTRRTDGIAALAALAQGVEFLEWCRQNGGFCDAANSK